VSTAIFSYGLPVITRKQLWTGKEELVKVLVGAVCRWLPLSLPRPDEATEVNGSTMMWPVSTMFVSWFDLFEGDQWFQRQSSRQDEEEVHDIDHRREYLESTDEEEVADPTTSDDIDARENSNIPTELPVKPITVSGVLHGLLDQATLSPNSMVLGLSEMELLPYKATVLENLAIFMDAIQGKMYSSVITHDLHVRLYEALKCYIVESVDRNSTPPVLVARSISCIASSLWQGIEDFSEVFTHFIRHTRNEAWSVRESSLLAINKIVQRATIVALQKLEFLEGILSLSSDAMQEKKFHRIRLAGMFARHSIIFTVFMYSSA